MPLPRVHSVELHDLPACPDVVRESIVETLGNALRWGRVYDPVAEAFAEWCARGRVDAVLDLCSGTGEPVAILLDALRRRGARTPRFALSDLYPNRARLQRVVDRYPELVGVVDHPVDATAVDPTIDRDGRTIISAFHHFPPPIAARILSDCAERRRPLFVLEPAPRSLTRGLGMVPWLVAAAAANPFLAPTNRTAKFLGTYALPVLWGTIAWDSVVSMLRMYHEHELRALAPVRPDYAWEYRRVPVRAGLDVTVFMGWPTESGGM